MIVIQIILILSFAVLLFKFLSSPSSSQMRAWKKIFGILFALIATGFVILPDSATRLAHKVGVGRGADLLLYMLTLAFIFVCINLYIKSKQDQKRVTELARKIAILEANQKKKN